MKITEILKSLKENTLKKLDFNAIEDLTKDNFIEITQFLMANTSVTEVILNDLQIGPKELTALVDSIKIHQSVAILHLEKVTFNLENIVIFNEIFKFNTSIHDLKIINCQLSGEELKVLANRIKYSSPRRGRIRYLVLDNNLINDNDLESIAEILGTNHYLCALSLKIIKSQIRVCSTLLIF